MKVLTTPSAINKEVQQLLKRCASCKIAVAWASVEFGAYERLLTHKSKIEQMVVGTHFYQTHPSFIESFQDHPNVKFILNPDGVFHPKIYLFTWPTGSWQCLIGSPNFTGGGFHRNTEMAVVISDDDVGGSEAISNVIASLDTYWAAAKTLNSSELEAYRAAWNRKQPLVRNLHGRFGVVNSKQPDDGGRNPLEIEILNLNWPEYFIRVKSEKRYRPNVDSTVERLKVMRAIKTLFQDRKSLKEIEMNDWKKIGGFVKADGVNFLWFGKMRFPDFKKAVNKKDEQITLALDNIPSVGEVTRGHYESFIRNFKNLSKGRLWLASATRLLAMKRPDYFICSAGTNADGLRGEFGIKGEIGYENYWDSIIERIMEAQWWNSSPPAAGTMEREIWEARTAFLDAIYYNGEI